MFWFAMIFGVVMIFSGTAIITIVKKDDLPYNLPELISGYLFVVFGLIPIFIGGEYFVAGNATTLRAGYPPLGSTCQILAQGRCPEGILIGEYDSTQKTFYWATVVGSDGFLSTYVDDDPIPENGTVTLIRNESGVCFAPILESTPSPAGQVPAEIP